MDCIFCKIINGDIPCNKVYEDSDVLAFLDINPNSKGHTLVVSKKHFETLGDIPTDISRNMMTAIQKIVPAVVSATNAEGYNIIMNNNAVAGQEVAHAHIHIIPRTSGDGLSFTSEHVKYEEDEASRISSKIASLING